MSELTNSGVTVATPVATRVADQHAHPRSPAYARVLAGVPLLVAVPPPSDAQLPVVLWCHGFRADALAHAAELEQVAAMGFLAIGIDAVGHGARIDPELGATLAASPGGALPVMLDLVEQTVRELPMLIDAIAAAYIIDRSRVSIVGISMGAFLTYRAIVAGTPLRAGVALLGSPEWPGHASPHRAIHAFRNLALLSITAEHDVSVPPDAVRRLHVALAQSSSTVDQHARHHYVLRGAGHLTSAHEWQTAMRVTMQWLQRYG